MTAERIKQIQQETAYPESVSVQQALLKVWNECEQDTTALREQVRKLREGLKEMVRCAPVNDGNMLESPVSFIEYWTALEISKQLLTETQQK